MSRAHINSDRIPKALLALILIASIIAIAGATLYYHSQKEKIKNRIFNELGIITTLKADEVRKWRQEHIRDGTLISRFFSSDRSMYSFLGAEENRIIRKEILQRLFLFLDDYDYHSAIVIDKKGSIRLIYPPADSTDIKFLPAKEFKTRDVEFSDLHFSGDLEIPHIDMLIPIIPPDSVSFGHSGLIILRINPNGSLFPGLRVLSTPSLPAEIMLVRRDVDSVTYLNKTDSEGRFIRRSMNNRELPAVKAVEGMEGFFEGSDYNGIPVLSYLRKIPDSTWSLIAKVEKAQALRDLYRHTVMVAIIVLLFISLFTAMVFYVWKNQNTRFYRELSDTKDKFVSIITHDLTSPFVTIVGFCEILIDDIKKGKGENVLRFSETIRDSSLAAMDLLKNLSQWSKVQTNQIRLNLKKINISSVIDESVTLMKPIAGRKNITIKTSYPDDLTICADKQMMSTVLRNLITNAIKYSMPGGEVIVNAGRISNGVAVDVIDFGTGMGPDQLRSILNSESNISKPGTLNESGTGLGLMLCMEFVERHGGSIYAESKPGEGSKFTFTIPEASC